MEYEVFQLDWNTWRIAYQEASFFLLAAMEA